MRSGTECACTGCVVAPGREQDITVPDRREVGSPLPVDETEKVRGFPALADPDTRIPAVSMVEPCSLDDRARRDVPGGRPSSGGFRSSASSPSCRAWLADRSTGIARDRQVSPPDGTAPISALNPAASRRPGKAG